MKESLFIEINDLATFNTVKRAADKYNNTYVIGEDPTVYGGTPDIKWNKIIFIREESLIYARGVFYTKNDEGNYIEYDTITGNTYGLIDKEININNNGGLSTILTSDNITIQDEGADNTDSLSMDNHYVEFGCIIDGERDWRAREGLNHDNGDLQFRLHDESDSFYVLKNDNLNNTDATAKVIATEDQINDGTLIIKQNGYPIGTFTANQGENSTINLITDQASATINDDIISSVNTWSSQKINSTLSGIYKFRGSVATYFDLPGVGGTIGHKLQYTDSNGTGEIIFKCGAIWDDVETGTMGGLKLTLEPSVNVVDAWFRNSETWSRSSNTNISIDGVTLVDLGGFTVSPTTTGREVREVTITFNNAVIVTNSSIISFDCVTWGAELENGGIQGNGYTLTKQNYSVVMNQTGDVWNVQDTDMNYAWTGTEWDALGGSTSAESIVVGGQSALADMSVQEALETLQMEQETADNIKSYATMDAYEADTTRTTPSISYIEETDEIIYDN